MDPEQNLEPGGFDQMADLIVVGSGGAALTAAYTAAKNGLRTLVLEKTPFFGGTSAYSGAGIWLPGNQVLARSGVQDTVERGAEYFHALVGDRTPQTLQDAYIGTGPELVEFLERDPYLKFAFLPFPDYFPLPGRAEGGRAIMPEMLPAADLGRWLPLLRPPIGIDQFDVPQDRENLIGGQALIGRLLLAAEATGNVDLRTGVEMTGLIVEEGRVTGVATRTESGAVRFGASRGVILAAGGFECDDALRVRYHGLPTGQWTSAAPGSNTGAALAAAVAVGADVDLMDEAWWCPATLFPNGRAAFTLGLRGGILVNAAGERFANESLPYDRLGHEIHRAHRAGGVSHIPAWLVFDGRFDELPATSQPAPAPGEFQEAGLWRTAESLDGLATVIGVPAGTLAATVERFNRFAATGTDEDFHRGEDPFDRFFATGDGPNPCLVPLDEGPYHAVQIVLGDLGTKGGARTDRDARVLDHSGTPIAGLFAIGNSAASVAGGVYPGPGTPLGSGMVFGYRAARRLLSEAS
ncbi:FAD-dependent oxidoreductase [Actinocorallia aurea]